MLSCVCLASRYISYPLCEPERGISLLSNISTLMTENVHIQINLTGRNIQNESVIYRVSAEGNTILVRAVANSLNLAPADVDFVAGEYYLDLTEDGRVPSVYIPFTQKSIIPPNVLAFFSLSRTEGKMSSAPLPMILTKKAFVSPSRRLPPSSAVFRPPGLPIQQT